MDQSEFAGRNMGCIVPILRAGAGLVLGGVIFIGFALSLYVSSVSSKLLNADFYEDIIESEAAYDRIYDEVLVDDELKEAANARSRILLAGLFLI